MKVLVGHLSQVKKHVEPSVPSCHGVIDRYDHLLAFNEPLESNYCSTLCGHILLVISLGQTASSKKDNLCQFVLPYLSPLLLLAYTVVNVCVLSE